MPTAEDHKAAGNTFFKNGEYAKAIEKYKEATALDPNVPAYWYVAEESSDLDYSVCFILE